MRMNTIARVILVTMLALGSGCAKSDWIQDTLITVDVTGTWQSVTGGRLELALKQQGSRVTGFIDWQGGKAGGGNTSGTIEGAVAGDVFRFRQVSGIQGSVDGELTVNGDEMSGVVRPQVGGGTILLRRVK